MGWSITPHFVAERMVFDDGRELMSARASCRAMRTARHRYPTRPRRRFLSHSRPVSGAGVPRHDVSSGTLRQD